MSRTLVVIVNYRTPELTTDCLESLQRHVLSESPIDVVVVDNASEDGSVETLRTVIEDRRWCEWVRLMPLEHNGGFASGNNAAIADALNSNKTYEFVWLLNPDTVVRQHALQKLCDFLGDHPTVGLVGSRLEDPDETPQRSAFRFPTLLSEIEDGMRFGPVSKLLSRYLTAPEVSDTCMTTDWVAGASVLIRRDVFGDIGVLDDRYFMYYEEVDFCKQAADAGWSCAYEPASRVVHLVGQASGVTNTKVAAKRRPQYWFESRRRYFVKNHGFLYAGLVDIAWAVSYATWCVRSKLQRKQTNEPPHLLTDFVRNSVLLRGAVT